MLDIVLSKYSFIYYVVILLCEVLTKYGYTVLEKTGKKKFLVAATILSCLGLVFLIYYSYATCWWAFICLLTMNALIYMACNSIRFLSFKLYGLAKETISSGKFNKKSKEVKLGH